MTVQHKLGKKQILLKSMWGGVFVDSEGKVNNGSEWVDCFRKNKSFTLTMKYTPWMRYDKQSAANLGWYLTTSILKYDNTTDSFSWVSTTCGGNMNEPSYGYYSGGTVTWSAEGIQVSIAYANDGNYDTDFTVGLHPSVYMCVKQDADIMFITLLENNGSYFSSVKITHTNGKLSYSPSSVKYSYSLPSSGGGCTISTGMRKTNTYIQNPSDVFTLLS